jgi:hypothetical protein
MVLCTLQIYQGTNPTFSLGCFLFILIASIAFNVAGGLSRPSGAYIFFFSILVVIVGLTWKAMLNEPADLNLLVPMTTIKVYVGTAIGMLAAAFISRRLTTKRALLADFASDESMQRATIGCMITGIALLVVSQLVPSGSGTILSAIVQLNRFLILTVILGVIHTVRRSGGTRSTSLPVLIAGAFIFLGGILSFAKEGIISPFACWLFAAASQRYRVSVVQVCSGLMVAYLIFAYLVPYSQYGRSFRQQDFTANLDSSISLLSNPDKVRSEYKAEEHVEDEDLAGNYFTNHQGFFDRLQMIGPDDSLNNLTEQGVVAGFVPVYLGFINLAPHFISPNKQEWGGGNLYARQMGELSEDDTSTGISFSPASESFHFMRWTGVFILAPVLYIILFTLFDSLCGDIRQSPWGLLVMLSFAHIAPEGGLGVLIYSLGYLTAAIVFAALTTTYLMPILGEILIGPSRKIVPLRNLRRQSQAAGPIDPSATIIS